MIVSLVTRQIRLASMVIARMLHEAGLPAGVMRRHLGRGRPTQEP